MTNLYGIHYINYDAGGIATLARKHLETASEENDITEISIWQVEDFGEEAELLENLLSSYRFRFLCRFEVRHKRQIASFSRLQRYGVEVTSF